MTARPLDTTVVLINQNNLSAIQKNLSGRLIYDLLHFDMESTWRSKELGHGWQHTAYDLENGRVLKRSNSWLRAFCVIASMLYPFNQYPLWKIPSYIQRARAKTARSFEILKRKELNPAWFAHPVFLDGLDYEQDRVMPIHQAFDMSTIDESKKVIDDVIVFQKLLLQHGLIDKYFNIAKNFGIDANGDIVLIDIGEVTEDEKMILTQRRMQAWEAPYILRHIKEPKLQSYYAEQMRTHFGVSAETV